MQIKRSFSAFSVVQSAVFQIKDEHKTVKITKKNKLASVSLSCKSRRFKTTFMEIFLSANSKHSSKLFLFYRATLC